MSLYYVRIDCNGKAINLVTHKGLNIFEGYAIECSTTSKSWILKRVKCKSQRSMDPCYSLLEVWCFLGLSHLRTHCLKLSIIPGYSSLISQEWRWGGNFDTHVLAVVSLSHINETCYRIAELLDVMRLKDLKVKFDIECPFFSCLRPWLTSDQISCSSVSAWLG
jgi:hypothetical protein